MFATSPRRRLHVLRRWNLPICVAICAAIVLLVYGPRDLTFTDSIAQQDFYDGLRECHKAEHHREVDISGNRANPRWNAVSGQKTPVIIQNASLFDGESTLPDFVDIIFDAGVIQSIIPTGSSDSLPENAQVIDIHGRHVTPGLVDIHSHHLLLPVPQLPATSDVNERPLLGPTTPFVRAIDGFTPSDPAIRLIASGGVTSSLVLPGSANIIGGEAYPVKNLPYPGADREPVIEELLLEHGIPESDHQRYLKMACGENPKGIYHHTRLGLSWRLREKLAEAQELEKRQSNWCRAAFKLEGRQFRRSQQISEFLGRDGRRPSSLEYETLIALLRGELNVNVHCYTPEDFERMLSVLHEFGVHPQAFHHALEAWQVPELLKHLERNITIATFADNALFKAEAYGANLRGPKILNEHGLSVAFKSDHTGEGNYAKYLLDQASIAHSFGLPGDKSLQSVTSVPARSMQQSHRIGYVRPGYDADLVIWDDHPLQVGATPVEVFIDGRPLLQEDTNVTALAPSNSARQPAPAMRPFVDGDRQNDVCARIQGSQGRVVFTGIRKALIESPVVEDEEEDLVLVVEGNQVSCLGAKSSCVAQTSGENLTEITLENGYITPGLVAFGNNLGIQAISSEGSTGDGSAGSSGPQLNEQRDVHFAKYGVHLHGRAFDRARIGGITKAITPPHGSGVIQGVSAGLRTSPTATILTGGIWRDNVALHLTIGQSAKDAGTPTVASGVEYVRRILEQGRGETAGQGSVYAQVANGTLPLVIQALNQDDIAQLILIKREFPTVNLVIYGGHSASLVAKPLAEAGIPVILTGNRGAPDKWEKKDMLPGPPLSDSPAKVLIDAGVLVGLAVKGDSKIHGLAREARWAGKQAGLTDRQAIALVSSNIELALGISKLSEGPYASDFVLWEGDPLRGEGSVVVAIQDDGAVGDCWPDDGL
ncbi:hypothetical protein BJX99DRAFT_269153 [Aspergillus californicus]